MARILEILHSEGSEHTALPELLARVALLEKKIEYFQTLVSPDKPVMDMPTVCRVLKLRPKAVSELAASGVLSSRVQGRRTVFYEEGVISHTARLKIGGRIGGEIHHCGQRMVLRAGDRLLQRQ